MTISRWPLSISRAGDPDTWWDPPELSALKAKHSWLSQTFPIFQLFHSLDHLRGPSLESLQYINVSLVLKSLVLQIQPPQCWIKREGPPISPACWGLSQRKHNPLVYQQIILPLCHQKHASGTFCSIISDWRIILWFCGLLRTMAQHCIPALSKEHFSHSFTHQRVLFILPLPQSSLSLLYPFGYFELNLLEEHLLNWRVV